MFANKKQKLLGLLISLLIVIPLTTSAQSAGDVALGIATGGASVAAQNDDFLTFLGCDDSNNNGLTIEDCVSSKNSGTVTSFIDFKGDLTAPNAEGYAKGLTQATDARTYILNVTNFALGFLGLIAVLIVIYGGVLSVISAGNPETAKKGKQAIMYAGIGLIIVMGSFALVNTILLAPSGSEKGSAGSSAINSTSIRGVAGSQRFNYLAQQIDDIILKVYQSYQFHLQAKQILDNSKASIEAFNENNCAVPFITCVNQFRSLAETQLITIKNLTGNSSATAIFKAGNAGLLTAVTNELNSKLPPIAAKIDAEDCNTDNKFAEINPCTEDNKTAIRAMFAPVKTSIAGMFVSESAKFLPQSYSSNIEESAYMTAAIYQTLRGLASNLIGQEYFKNLIPGFVTSGNLSTYKGDESAGLFKSDDTERAGELVIGTPITVPKQDSIKGILKNLVQIKSVLQNLKFVAAVISADTNQGNAPLIVNFSSVGSTDPSGFGIDPKNITWDLNGDGEFGKFSGEDSAKGLMNCSEIKADTATASCIFTKPGTYRVTLKINPVSIKTNSKAIDPATGIAWEQEVAPGISYIDILVNPASTKINLDVSTASGANKKSVIKYDDNKGTIVEEHNQVYFTLSEAKAGLVFDATKSKYSSGADITTDTGTQVRWNFGVASENNDTFLIPSNDSLKKTQVYPAIGNYQVKFEVMDKNGVMDRKIFTVVVSNLAPRISNPPTTGEVGKQITFDGSDSTSDGGPLIFDWRIEKLNTTAAVTASAGNLEKFAALVAHAADSEQLKLAALVSPAESLSKPSAAQAQTPVVPVKTLEPSKRSESNDFYSCEMPAGKDDILNCVFKKAGDYKIILSLDDNGVPREESTIIKITSTAPTAAFKPTKLSDSAPALYKLDATNFSYDPDEKDNSNLEYSWEFNPNNCILIGFADQNTEADLISGSTDAFSAQTPCDSLKDFNGNSGQPVIKFTAKGSYTANLVVRTADEPDLESVPYEQSIAIDNVLDVAWGEMKPSAMLQVAGATGTANDQLPSDVNSAPVAPITFIFSSSQAISYDLDFGDGLTESGDMNKGEIKQVIHNYTATGKYTASLSVFDADDVENSISRKIFIGDSKSPIAIVTTLVDGSEVQPIDITLDNGQKVENVIVVNRKQNLTFDAEKSLNTDGTGRRLKYSWNLNNNEKQSTARLVSYKFTQMSENGKPYPVQLKVSNEKDATQVGTDTVNILVVGEAPTLRSLTAVSESDALVTPVSVKLSAVGANDPDGRIVQYKWWYYDANKPATPDERLGLQITTIPSAILNIGTRGVEGEKPKYKFGIELTDDDNQVVSTDNQNENFKLNITTPELQVTNGPNKAPIARFTVDRTSVNVGEPVNFTSSSTDPDAGGGIKEYKWDFGDGSKGENKASVSHTYQKANIDGYKVKLTVVDNNSSEATSDPIRIYVDAQAQPPVASFTSSSSAGSKTVQFTSTSTADEAAGATIKKYSWDFDVATDSNGDGKKDNDIESGEPNPSHTYPNYGIFRAKLTVEDNQGQVRSVTNFVNVKPEVPKVAWTGGNDSADLINQGASDSASKTVGANLFEASHKVDLGVLAACTGAYAILFLISRKKLKNQIQK
jgi:PKD repeat protein